MHWPESAYSSSNRPLHRLIHGTQAGSTKFTPPVASCAFLATLFTAKTCAGTPGCTSDPQATEPNPIRILANGESFVLLSAALYSMVASFTSFGEVPIRVLLLVRMSSPFAETQADLFKRHNLTLRQQGVVFNHNALVGQWQQPYCSAVHVIDVAPPLTVHHEIQAPRIPGTQGLPNLLDLPLHNLESRTPSWSSRNNKSRTLCPLWSHHSSMSTG